MFFATDARTDRRTILFCPVLGVFCDATRATRNDANSQIIVFDSAGRVQQKMEERRRENLSTEGRDVPLAKLLRFYFYFV